MNDNRNSKPRTNDPQIVVEGRLKQGDKADTITFHLLDANGIFERVCIVTIPPEGETSAPVYIKHKLRDTGRNYDYRRQQENGFVRRTRRGDSLDESDIEREEERELPESRLD